jgi:hypothetical protein
MRGGLDQRPAPASHQPKEIDSNCNTNPEEIALILERYAAPGQKIRATLEGVAPGFLMHSADAMQKVAAAAEKAKNKGARTHVQG